MAPEKNDYNKFHLVANEVTELFFDPSDIRIDEGLHLAGWGLASFGVGHILDRMTMQKEGLVVRGVRGLGVGLKIAGAVTAALGLVHGGSGVKSKMVSFRH